MKYTLDEHIINELIKHAISAREHAYAVYSGFKVGAALLADTGEIIGGCNIENASYPAGNCAERTAIFSAVNAGFRNFKAIAIVAGKEEISGYTSPCGICRQVLRVIPIIVYERHIMCMITINKGEVDC